MDSNEVEIEQSTTELKHLGFLKQIAVKLLVLLSILYDFAKENSGVHNSTVVSSENAVVSAVAPVYEKLKAKPEQILVFVDGKFDKYAPSLLKKVVAKFQSLIDKSIPLVQKLLAMAKTVITPLIITTISLLNKIITTIKTLIQKIFTTIKSAPLVSKARTLLQKCLTTTKSLLESTPLVGTAQSIVQNTLNTTKYLVNDSLQKAPDVAKQALDTTKSMVGGIPLVGDVSQSLITNPTDLATQLVDTTKSLFKENPTLEAVNSAAQNIVKTAQAAGIKATLQLAYTSFKLVAIPIIAKFWYKVNTHPMFQKLSKVFVPVAEYLCERYNKVVTYMDGKGYNIFGYLPSVPIEEMKAAYKLVKTTMDGLSSVGDVVGMDDDNN